MPNEMVLLQAALWLYLLAALVALAPAPREFRTMVPMAVVSAALVLQAWSIALRWVRLGHGPYVDLFEILSSNVWSLHLVLLIACLLFRRIRDGLPGALPVLSVLVLWLMVTPARDTALPVTYATFWLPVHMVLGKLFLGLVVAAVGLALVVLARRIGGGPGAASAPAMALEALAHRLMLAAVVFQSLMLVAGAAWARDAWGRYWAWDPLESWAFLSWVAMLAYLHWRPRNQEATALSAALIVGVYALAFMTFFGVPFISVAPHKGAV